MSELSGTWNIYSQRIGGTPVFKTPVTQVMIDGNNTTEGFDLAQGKEKVTLGKKHTYYSGETTNYTYRVQVGEKDGFKALFGNVSTKAGGKEPHRCGFIGLQGIKELPALKAHTIPVLLVPFYHEGNHPHKNGKLAIDVPGKKASLKLPDGEIVDFQTVSFPSHPQGGTAIVASAQEEHKLKGWILACPHQNKRRLVFVGDYWRAYKSNQSNPFGGPTNPECAKKMIIDPWGHPIYLE